MLDLIISSLKDDLAGQIGSKFGLSEDKVDDAAVLAKDSILDGFKSEISGGNIAGLLNLFNGKESMGSSSLVGNIVNRYASDMFTKLGLSKEMSATIAQFAIPFIMNKINDKTPNDGIRQGELMDMVGESVMDSIKDKLAGGLGSLFGK